MCANYVKNFHSEYFHADPDILSLYSTGIDIGISYWNEQINFQELEDFAGYFWTTLEKLGTTEHLKSESLECNLSHARAIYAMTSVWECLRVTLYDSPFNETIENDLIDSDTDFYDWDAAYCAAVAYAGSEWDLENSDKDRRLQFWMWWLKDAVPQVFEM